MSVASTNYVLGFALAVIFVFSAVLIYYVVKNEPVSYFVDAEKGLAIVENIFSTIKPMEIMCITPEMEDVIAKAKSDVRAELQKQGQNLATLPKKIANPTNINLNPEQKKRLLALGPAFGALFALKPC